MMVYFHLKKIQLVFSINYFTHNLHQKHFNNSTAYKRTLRMITNRVTMKIFTLERDGVIAGWRKMHVKELHNLFYSQILLG